MGLGRLREESKRRLEADAAKMLPAGEELEALALASQIGPAAGDGSGDVATALDGIEGNSSVGTPNVTPVVVLATAQAIYVCWIDSERTEDESAGRLERTFGVTKLGEVWRRFEIGSPQLKVKRSVPGMPARFVVGDLDLSVGAGAKGDAREFVEKVGRMRGGHPA